MARLNGIDIANYQSSLVVGNMTTTEFAIVKATESNWYVNECFAKHAKQTVKAGKLLGCYHFARPGSAVEQADYFVKACKSYIGKALLALDWEDDAVALGPAWAKRWLDRVYKKTGVKPVIYMSKSVSNSYDWSAVSKAGYELWVAQYPDYSETGYQSNPWTDSSPFGSWAKPRIFQYTSMGRIAGYSGRLDLDLFYGSKAAWNRLAKGSAAKALIAKVTSGTAKTVSKVEKMCKHAEEIAADDTHGYSQVRRWPSQGTDFDCSSLVIECAAFAGYDIPTGYGYTGSMLATFKAAGFTAIPFKQVGLAGLKRGDVLLNVQCHTELCIGNGKFVGAHIAETGGVDGKPGDQTGNEISVCNAYVYSDGWDWVLRPPAEDGAAPAKVKAPVFRVSTDSSGLVWRKRGVDGVAGKAIRYIAVKNVGNYRVFTQKSGWLPYVSGFNVKDFEDGCAGDGSPILAVEIANSDYRYAVRPKGGDWYPDMVGRIDTSGSSDHFAGDLANAIDSFRVSKA